MLEYCQSCGEPFNKYIPRRRPMYSLDRDRDEKEDKYLLISFKNEEIETDPISFDLDNHRIIYLRDGDKFNKITIDDFGEKINRIKLYLSQYDQSLNNIHKEIEDINKQG